MYRDRADGPYVLYDVKNSLDCKRPHCYIDFLLSAGFTQDISPRGEYFCRKKLFFTAHRFILHLKSVKRKFLLEKFKLWKENERNKKEAVLVSNPFAKRLTNPCATTSVCELYVRTIVEGTSFQTSIRPVALLDLVWSARQWTNIHMAQWIRHFTPWLYYAYAMQAVWGNLTWSWTEGERKAHDVYTIT